MNLTQKVLLLLALALLATALFAQPSKPGLPATPPKAPAEGRSDALPGPNLPVRS